MGQLVPAAPARQHIATGHPDPVTNRRVTPRTEDTLVVSTTDLDADLTSEADLGPEASGNPDSLVEPRRPHPLVHEVVVSLSLDVPATAGEVAISHRVNAQMMSSPHRADVVSAMLRTQTLSLLEAISRITRGRRQEQEKRQRSQKSSPQFHGKAPFQPVSHESEECYAPRPEVFRGSSPRVTEAGYPWTCAA